MVRHYGGCTSVWSESIALSSLTSRLCTDNAESQKSIGVRETSHASRTEEHPCDICQVVHEPLTSLEDDRDECRYSPHHIHPSPLRNGHRKE
jgi:hypothetical protein